MASPTSTNPAHAHFESFLQAQLCQDVLSSFQGLCGALGLEPGGGLPQYHKIKAQLNYWSAKSLWAKLDKRAGQPVYQQGQACASTKVNTWRRGTVENGGQSEQEGQMPNLPCPVCWQCLVVGAGPCGLRAAVELALLGAHVVLVEKRTKFSRHNVLHLWPFTIHDLRALGAKKFYGRFCTGTLDHISEYDVVAWKGGYTWAKRQASLVGEGGAEPAERQSAQDPFQLGDLEDLGHSPVKWTVGWNDL